MSSPVGNRIKKLRKEKNMTQEELGELIGVKKAAIQKLESGTVQSLKFSNIITLCDFFNISPNELICSKEEELKNEVKSFELLNQTYGELITNTVGLITLLNEEGQTKVLDYCLDLHQVDKYKSSSSSSR